MAKKTTTKQVRRKKSVNKSQAVRDYMASNPDAKPKEISETLAKKGIKITPQAVSTIKFQANKQSATAVRRKGRGGANGVLKLDDLVEAKKLADKLGGVGQARQALDALAKLQ